MPYVVVFTYDHLNRRVRKLVYAWDPNEGESDWSATAELDLHFIYHERLLLLELGGLDSGAKVRKHAWTPGPTGPFRTALNQRTESTERGANIVMALSLTRTGVGSLTR